MRDTWLSGKDRRAMAWLAVWGHALAADIAIATRRSERTLANRLARLRREGWLAADRPTAGPAAWRVTAPGLSVAQIHGFRAPPPIGAGRWLHEMTVAAIAAALTAKGLAVRPGKRIGEGEDAHRADLELLGPDGEPILYLELELSGKDVTRRRRILGSYAGAGRAVLYLAPPRVAAPLVRTAGRLHMGEQFRVLLAPTTERSDGVVIPDRALAGDLARRIGRSLDRIETTRAQSA